MILQWLLRDRTGVEPARPVDLARTSGPGEAEAAVGWERARPGGSSLLDLEARIHGAWQPGRRGPPPVVLASEKTGAVLVRLPLVSARRRASLLPFAIEDRLAQPVEEVVVAEAHLSDPSAPAGTRLAIVVARAVLEEAEASRKGAVVVPDVLALPRPEAREGAAAWLVWSDGTRAVVRCSDGTGFAVPASVLEAMWERAGRPFVGSCAAPLGWAATDLSAAPPPPDPIDLRFTFRSAEAEGRSRTALLAAAGIAGAALVLHLGLAAADVLALGRIAAVERGSAELALADILPDASLEGDPALLLAQLSPTPTEARRSDFLPLLSEVSVALTDEGVALRRLSWSAEGGLALLVQGDGLDDLQAAEQVLRGAGLRVRSGSASAGEGGAEVEMQITRDAQP